MSAAKSMGKFVLLTVVLLSLLTVAGFSLPAYARDSGEQEPSVEIESYEPAEAELMDAATSPDDPAERELPIADMTRPEVASNTGAAAYTVPIAVPPGRAGMTPSISLNYNSYRRNGWVGVGWDLNLGYIQRSTRKGLDYDGNDYILKTAESTVELVPRPDWCSGSGDVECYGAKIEKDFSKFEKYPGKWVVTAKDGKKYTYGATIDSRLNGPGGKAFRWYLGNRSPGYVI